MSATPHLPGYAEAGQHPPAAASAGSKPKAGSRPSPLIWLAAAAIAAVLIAAGGLWQVGSSMARQACIADAIGRYPAVPVSAYAGRTTGALKLSFTEQRQQALQSCD